VIVNQEAIAVMFNDVFDLIELMSVGDHKHVPGWGHETSRLVPYPFVCRGVNLDPLRALFTCALADHLVAAVLPAEGGAELANPLIHLAAEEPLPEPAGVR
jgi:hypothetical protein